MFRSVAYLAPEMLRKKGHGKAVDWYLLGVLFYEMLIGMPPYYANTQQEIFNNIENAPLKIPSHLSKSAKSLIKQVRKLIKSRYLPYPYPQSLISLQKVTNNFIKIYKNLSVILNSFYKEIQNIA